MFRHALPAVWLGICLALVAVGALVRFDGPEMRVDPLLHGLLFFFAGLMLTTALICWLPLLRHLPVDWPAGRIVLAFVLGPAVALVLLVALALEGDAATEARHRAYLLRIADGIADDYRRRGRMPALLEDAVSRDDRGLIQRFDADGGLLSYRRLDRRHALLCAPNRRVHVVIGGSEVDYLPWPPGAPDPCWNRPGRRPYWAGEHASRGGVADAGPAP